MFYFVLYLLYTMIPPIAFYFVLTKIYQEKDKNGWHLLYLTKFYVTLSFLPILYFNDVDLALTPTSPLSIFFFIITVALSVYGIKFAVKKNVLQMYMGGVFASLMEEILFRGVIFGLIFAIWQSNLLAIILSSLSFGIWHLKNYGYYKNKKWVATQFLYTAIIYGPIFSVMRIATGDIYLAVLFHFFTDAYVVLAPKSWRWTIINDRQEGEGFKDV